MLLLLMTFLSSRECLLSTTTTTVAFEHKILFGVQQPSTRIRHRRGAAAVSSLAAAATPKTPPLQKEEGTSSAFWNNVATDDASKKNLEQLQQLPAVPTLDRDGPLPPGAYVTLGNSLYEPKPTCRISVAVGTSNSNNPQQLQDYNEDDANDPAMQVAGLHRLMDAGFTSFVFSSSSSLPTTTAADHRLLYRLLQQQTPPSVMQHVEVTVPLLLSSSPPSSSSSSSTRTLVKDWLAQCNADALDNVQLVVLPDDTTSAEFKSSSRSRSSSTNLHHHHYGLLEALDALQELQRQGLVRRISMRNLSQQQQLVMQECGFESIVTSHTVDGGVNLLQPLLQPHEGRVPPLSRDDYYSSSCSSSTTNQPPSLPLLVTSPLAGGLLTDRYRGLPMAPWQSWDQQQYHWPVLDAWGQRRHQQRRQRQHLRGQSTTTKSKVTSSLPVSSSTLLWKEYQALLETMQEMAWQNRVDIAAVALRWLLQQQQQQPDSCCTSGWITSAVVSSRLVDSEQAAAASPAPRAQALRKVFTFALDKEEMERLDELSGWKWSLEEQQLQQQQEQQRQDDFDPDEYAYYSQRGKKEEGRIDFTNRKLWL